MLQANENEQAFVLYRTDSYESLKSKECSLAKGDRCLINFTISSLPVFNLEDNRPDIRIDKYYIFTEQRHVCFLDLIISKGTCRLSYWARILL